MTPSGVTRPSLPAFVYQMLRSGPTAMLIGEPPWLGIGNSVTLPSSVMRADAIAVDDAIVHAAVQFDEPHVARRRRP